MIDSARIQAAIEILNQVADSLLHDGPSADVLIRKYFKTRRYAGSRDRRYVTDLVYQVIRNWGLLADVTSTSIRKMVMLSLKETKELDEIKSLFGCGNHGPEEITEDELEFLTLQHEKAPHHLLNYPIWLEVRLRERFAENFDLEMEALNGRASFDFRVNLAKTTVDKAEEILKVDSIDYHKGKWAETALILEENPRIDAWEIYKDGLVEVQGEAAQLAVQLSDIKPGQQVMDLCAGAGGKTLAAAAYMDNKGQIYAFDNNNNRLKDFKPRAKRANARILQARHLDTAGGKRRVILSEYQDAMDRVILDVPCSGSGVWRRNPEAKWRLSEEKLTQYCRIQKNLLSEGWQFVKPGGRMIYMTCSLFKDENEKQIEEFREDHKKVKLISYEKFSKNADLKSLSSLPECLALSPYSHGTDGFFVAIMEKAA